MLWAFSISSNAVPGIITVRNLPTTSRSFVTAIVLGQNSSTSGVGSIVETECDGKERQPRHELGRAGGELGAQALLDTGIGIVASEAHASRAELRARPRTASMLVYASHTALRTRKPDASSRSSWTSRDLADPGLAHDVDQLALACARGGKRLAHHAKLRFAAGQPQAVERRLTRARARRGADRPGANGLRLALDCERCELPWWRTVVSERSSTSAVA